jgi:hypothetical protein
VHGIETQPRVPGGGGGRVAAPAQRVLAFTLDLCVALAAVLLLQLAIRHGLVAPFGAWRPDGFGPGIDPQSVALAIALVALRDVPTGASFAKWLLALRVVGTDGTTLPLGLRLLRAPLSVLPFEWVAGEARGRLPWRVVPYAPSFRGLVARAALALLAGIWSVVWGVETLRPSIGRRDAGRLARTVIQDPALARALGPPLETEVRSIVPRSRMMLRGDEGEFELRVRGTRGRQDMRVRSLRIDGHWAVDEVVDIEITMTDANGRDTVAVR